MRVPVFKEERYCHDPLPTSFSEPFDALQFGEINVVERKYGQILKGDMIPERELRLVASDDKGKLPGMVLPTDTAPTSKRSPKRKQLKLPTKVSGISEEETFPLLASRSEEIVYGSTDDHMGERKLTVNVETGGTGVEVSEDFH